jgi:hypothetical protein
MRKYSTAISVLILCYFVACNKSSDDGVFIRVKNNTTQEFKEILTNNKSFEHVTISEVTSYQHFTQVSALAFVILIDNNNDTVFAGTHYLDPPFTYLKNGYYTVEVFEDTSAYYGYDCRYVRD